MSRTLTALCGVLAVAGAVAALTTRSPGGSWSTALLAAALCAAPLLVLAVRRLPADRRPLPLLVAGLVLAVAGAAAADLAAAQELLAPGTAPRMRAALAAGTAAPFGWAACGVALALAGPASRARDRLLAGLATGVVVLVQIGLAGALAARSVAGSPRSALVVEAPIAATAGLVAVAAVLLVVVAVTAAVVPERPRDAGSTAASWTAVGAVTALLVIAGGWAWAQSRPDAPGPARPLAELFPDEALAACVARALGLPGAASGATDRELAGIEQLRCDGQETPGAPITSLTGIDALPALSALELPRNAISDLTPLAGTNVGALALTGNAVTDLGPLAGLELFDLGLSQNPISDLAPLAGMTTLNALGVASAQLTDISALAGKTGLRDLDLSGNAITDVSPLAGLPNLDTLGLNGNRIVDPSPLGTIPTLLILDLFGNQVGAIGGLADAPLLQQLQLGANPVTDLTPLLRTTSLVNLGLDETDSTRLTGVEQLRAAGVSVNGLA